MSSEQFKYSNSIIIYPLLIVFLLWLVFWYQINIDYGIKSFGIRPLKLQGLVGVFTSPFLHVDINHLYNNSLPLLVLSLALFYFYNKIAWQVIIYGILLSGILTWFIGRSGNHIGASGLIYVLVSFIFFKGVFTKYYRLVALSLMVIFLYGSMIWYVFPIKDGISWEGHLAGLITGLIFALVLKKQVAKPKLYQWQQPDYKEEDDPFMRHFDEDGNFIELEPEIELEDEFLNRQGEDKDDKSPTINYIFRKRKPEN